VYTVKWIFVATGSLFKDVTSFGRKYTFIDEPTRRQNPEEHHRLAFALFLK
jgi:hypothetical protein